MKIIRRSSWQIKNLVILWNSFGSCALLSQLVVHTHGEMVEWFNKRALEAKIES